MTGQPSGNPPQVAAQESGRPKGAFVQLMEAFQAIQVPLEPDEERSALEDRRRRLQEMIDGHITDARWRELMRRAQEAAERGKHEYLLLRFPSAECTDHGRAISEEETDWPNTLTGDAASVYRHWHDEVGCGGFGLVARILGYPGGLPGDVGLFLTWPPGAPRARPRNTPGPVNSTHPGTEDKMRTLLLLTASGPIVILTSYASAETPALIEKLGTKGIRKFIAFDIPLELARERYANHFVVVAHDLHETDDLRVLDFDGQRALQLFRFAELGQPTFHEGA